MNWRHSMVLLATAGALLAQGPRGNGPQNAPALRAGGALDVSQTAVIEGEITSVSIGAGIEYPSITVDDKAIKVAPVWYLLDRDFELAVGDQVKVKAVHCLCAEDTWYALEITKGEVTLELRDSLGIPLWVRMLGGRGEAANGNRGNQAVRALPGGVCLDPATVQGYQGTVVNVNTGVGIQQPTMVLRTAEGKLVTIRLGPERVLLENDVELAAGAQVRIVAGVSTCTEALVALELTTADGVTIRLRDDTGRPVWAR
ncbi:MAG: hypothetical protein ACUVS7_04745 [Bryobacteraceae bacterium]